MNQSDYELHATPTGFRIDPPRQFIARRRCGCGRTLVPHANGTVPRHTMMIKGAVRVRCPHVGELFAAIARQRGRDVRSSDMAAALRERGGRRAGKRDRKNTYKRNSAGGYNGRVGSAGSSLS